MDKGLVRRNRTKMALYITALYIYIYMSPLSRIDLRHAVLVSFLNWYIDIDPKLAVFLFAFINLARKIIERIDLYIRFGSNI